MISRRGLLLGAPAVVLAANLMPVRDWLRLDPLAAGIRYQSWPLDQERPYFHFQGTISHVDRGMRRPASHWVDQMKRYSEMPHYQLIWSHT